ncbi:hypothetical protein, partial [Sporosarcina sp. USHLN248]|uniref:hypothetical protein n=1 Tax=Sporosarcina sp. USHLN248 TaxID=3081300 RepID=UPI003017C4ED
MSGVGSFCVPLGVYARHEKFLRYSGSFCIVGSFYAFGGEFMSGVGSFCVPLGVYARHEKFLRYSGSFCIVGSFYAFDGEFMSGREVFAFLWEFMRDDGLL